MATEGASAVEKAWEKGRTRLRPVPKPYPRPTMFWGDLNTDTWPTSEDWAGLHTVTVYVAEHGVAYSYYHVPLVLGSTEPMYDLDAPGVVVNAMWENEP